MPEPATGDLASEPTDPVWRLNAAGNVIEVRPRHTGIFERDMGSRGIEPTLPE